MQQMHRQRETVEEHYKANQKAQFQRKITSKQNFCDATKG